MPKVIDLPTATSMSDSDYLIMEASGGGTKKITKANARGTVPISQGGTGQTGLITGTTVSDLITVNSSNATITGVLFAVWGKVITYRITWKNVNDISVPANGNITNIGIGTIVSGKRPAIAETAGWSNGDGAGGAWYRIQNTGAVSLGAVESTGAARTIAAGTEFNLCATYIIA